MPTPAQLQAVLENEFKLRDYIAGHLDDLEPGLRLLKEEYELTNSRGGAGGRTDILAADDLDHIVVIELKRSDKTAREATHELSKYVSLLIERDRIPRELIRCIVVSTAWHELELSLAYFRATAHVDVVGLKPSIENGKLIFLQQPLMPVSTLPQFSPEFSIFYYEDRAQYDVHIARIEERAKQVPFARAASCLFAAASSSPEQELVAIMCLWRIQPKDYDVLESQMEEPIGHLFPYAYPGWEAECDCLFWLADETDTGCTIPITAESARGTPEKALTISASRAFVQMDRIGDWPKLEIVNTFDRILAQLTAVAGLTGTPRRNRHQFNATVSPRYKPSWDKTKTEFINFLRGVPQWQDIAQQLCAALETMAEVNVTFSAADKNNFFYALHQCTEHAIVGLSNFSISAHRGEVLVFLAEGSWAWDGSRTFGGAAQEIEAVFGSPFLAVHAAYSAVDQGRYEAAYQSHGFHPYVRVLVELKGKEPVWDYLLQTAGAELSLSEFVERHADYVAEVSSELSRFGHLPTSPASA